MSKESKVVEMEAIPSHTPHKVHKLEPLEDLQILRPDGSVDQELEPSLSDEELLRVHRAMVLTRKFDIRMLNMQRQGQMGTFAPGFGQEATQIGAIYPLTDDDWFVPSYRSFGAQIWRGWEMERLLLLWDGFFEGFPPPPGLKDYPFSIVIGSHVPMAVGTAMSINYKEEPGVVMTNFGDGAASEGAVAEALNFAGVFNAPCIFVLENNGYAISTTIDKQTRAKQLALRGLGYGVPSIRVDGNDVLAMIVASTEMVAHARAGHGPGLIEAVTYRMGVHTTADDPTVYRKNDEVEGWKAKCPILRFEKYLKKKGVLNDEQIEDVGKQCEQEVLEARDRFRERAKANPHEVFDYVYTELTPELEAQREEYLEKLRRKGL